ncbi:MAG: hypothetical protein GY925_29335 [Actinomycetia bacterium]|nr:hypothetical protein [Actinomycetes bacterium]
MDIVELISLLVALLGAAILLFGLGLFVANRVNRRRLAGVSGPFLVRVGSPKGRGRDGEDLDDRFESLDEARAAAQEALLTRSDELVAHVLGQRPDGQWDVVDRVDVLQP